MIVLLILAGISISMLSGDNSILSRATQARTKTGNAQDEDTISLAYLAAVTGKYSEGSDMSTTLKNELEKTYGSGKVTVTKNETNNSYEVAITGKGTYTIDANGKVEKQGPAVTYANERIVTSSDGTGTTVAAGTKTPNTDKLYIYFEASVEGGTTSISPSVPFEITENGTYNFKITSTVNGETFTTTHQVIAKQYAARAGIKVGDYITYTPSNSNTTTSVSFSQDETGYTGTNNTLSRKNQFRVMDIDEEGNMELMGVMTSSDPTIYFSGAQGYNNAVSVLNNKCSELYKDTSKGITARSINEEDITKRFNAAGKKKMTDYIDGQVGTETTTGKLDTGSYITAIDKTNKTVTYVNSKSYYPNLFQYEEGGKIGDLETGIPETNPKQTVARSAKAPTSLYGADEILTGADKDENNNAIPRASKSATTLTVPYTYSSTTHTSDDFDNSEGKASKWQEMFFGTGIYYWLASRCIDCNSNYANFYVRYVSNSNLNADVLYNSYASTNSAYSRVCPVVSIPSSVKVTLCTGTNDSTHPHTVAMTN